ncbi:KAP family P-loop NTPase fold protein [Galbitalea soli]|uniref:NTPase KAP n=1 Tax=Galbitalea soli TaxID=1268042 RepID=A0A7C9PMK0_9MICO|nr:P-loop NTPase fold protein [Galbitalea soli]NEM90886.1 NTPase KAP [Galbitalea soli]NYJ31607.1 hypothetical protein [Galbitalea soli]
MANEDTPYEQIPLDVPIEHSSQDVLGRAHAAQDFAKTIRELDARKGLVVGVLGPWGHGKSSFINLMGEEFAKEPALTIVEFNPWMFSGTQQLAEFFFLELSAELRIKKEPGFDEVAQKIDEYADVLAPLAIIPWVGGWWDRTRKAFGTIVAWRKTRRQGSRTERQKVSDALSQLEHPIVVVVDDIDRLSSDEIRDMFKLVRLTASFPNLIYLLAFDRGRVEQALSVDGVTGRSYLEKIVLLSYDVPQIPVELLRSHIFAELNRILGDLDDPRYFDQERWNHIYFEVIEPLLHNIRDVTRFAVSARTTIRSLGKQVSVVDLIAMEAIRVFRPEIYFELADMRGELTSIGHSGLKDNKTEIKARYDELFKLADNHFKPILTALIEQVFPAGRQHISNWGYGIHDENKWRRDHRLATSHYLSLYFDRVIPSGLREFRTAEEASEVFDDETALTKLLRGVPRGELLDVIQGLEAYEPEYRPEDVVPTSVALLNLLPEIEPNPNPGFLDIMTPDLAVTRVVLRLFRRLENETDREKATTEVLAKVKTVSGRFTLIHMVGYRQGVGHKLVSEKFAEEIENAFIDGLLATPPKHPEKETSLLRAYLFVNQLRPDVAPLAKIKKAALLESVFSSGKSANRSWHGDGGPVRSVDVLPWDILVTLFGDEATLKRGIEIVRKAKPDAPILALLDKYLDGWRPDSWGDGDRDGDDD